MSGAESRRKWFGPACVVFGAAMLAAQVYLWISAGTLSARLNGGGTAVLFIGIVACFYAYEDWRSGARAKEEFPSANEFDRDFRLTDSDGRPQSE
jgi:hypothetical protein